MATIKQIEANRNNSKRSTGPITDAGKAKARYNAITHGMRRRGLDLLPRENAEAFRANLDAWSADYSPIDETEAQLVQQAATLSWKLDRMERHEAILVSKRIREAVARAEQDRRDRVDDAYRRLLPPAKEVEQSGYDGEHAADLLATIEATADGCRRLIERWQYLRDAVRTDPFWIPEFEMHAIRLSGSGPRRITDPAVLDLVVANRVLASPGVWIDPFRRLDSTLGLIFGADAVRDACLRRSDDPAQAKLVLTAAADRAIARLQQVLEVRERDGDLGSEEIDEAAELAAFDPGNEAERLRQYQFTMQRQFVKAVETIAKLRLQRAKLGGNRANEANFEGDGDCPDFPRAKPSNADVGESWKMGLSPSPTADVENRANEANFGPEKRANEANSGPEVQVAFAAVREETVGSEPAISATAANRAERRRRKALLRRLGKA